MAPAGRGREDTAMSGDVTVAIPTLNAGPSFADTLAAVRTQRFDGNVELLVCDSGSSDETVTVARTYCARIIEIPRETFSHGATRNLLMARAEGEHVAFLSQDAVPADDGWLQALIDAFALVPNVGLAFGPYRPRSDTNPSVAREITAWFDSFSSTGPRIDVLPPGRREAPDRDFLGHVGFFTDANGAVARSAWKTIPFRAVAYAEDHRLAQDMLRGGFAKVYVPAATVIHAHDYSRWNWLRRSFDESRAVLEVYSWAPDLRTMARGFRGSVVGDLRAARTPGSGGRRAQLAVLLNVVTHHGVRAIGGFLGPRSQRLPRSLTRRLSLEGRA